MSTNHVIAGMMMLVGLAGPLARAESPIPLATETPAAATTVTTPGQVYAPESWIYQPGEGCCGPAGKHGPIGTEVYGRGGVSIVVGNNAFSKSLKTGWEVMGGGRSLFFNQAGDRAFVVDLGVSFTNNDGKSNNIFNFQGTPVTIQSLYRTAFSLGLGMDWFARGPGDVGSFWGTNVRYGFDMGARWGTTHVDLNNVDTGGLNIRSHDVYAAGFAALHVDLEIPMGAWTLLTGLRGEYAYSVMELIPGSNTNLQEVNALFTVGVRY